MNAIRSAFLAITMIGTAHAQVQTGPLDLTGRTLTDLAAQMQQGHLTSSQITQWYLDRIGALDRQGPKIQAVIAISVMLQNSNRNAFRLFFFAWSLIQSGSW